MNTIVVYHRSSHHAQTSGYSRLTDYIEAKHIPNKKSILPYRLAKFIGNNCDQHAGIYDSNSVKKEIELLKTLASSKKGHNIVHYLNAERDIRYVAKNRRLFSNTLFCGTFHKPPEILLKSITDTRYLTCLNGAIAVGVNQVDFLKNWLDTDKVSYIPHGVDTHFFEPDLSKGQTKTLLFVGQHLRDFESFNYCVPIIAKHVKNLKVRVIIRKDFTNKIKPHKCIRIFNNLNDLELKKCYQEASALFLPLLNVTACNSILEAMACGLPIITTNVGSNISYLSKTENVLAPADDKEYLIDAAIELLNNEDKLVVIGKSSRSRSKDYEWSIIAKEIENFYGILKSSN